MTGSFYRYLKHFLLTILATATVGLAILMLPNRSWAAETRPSQVKLIVYVNYQDVWGEDVPNDYSTFFLIERGRDDWESLGCETTKYWRVPPRPRNRRHSEYGVPEKVLTAPGWFNQLSKFGVCVINWPSRDVSLVRNARIVIFDKNFDNTNVRRVLTYCRSLDIPFRDSEQVMNQIKNRKCQIGSLMYIPSPDNPNGMICPGGGFGGLLGGPSGSDPDAGCIPRGVAQLDTPEPNGTITRWVYVLAKLDPSAHQDKYYPGCVSPAKLKAMIRYQLSATKPPVNEREIVQAIDELEFNYGPGDWRYGKNPLPKPYFEIIDPQERNKLIGHDYFKKIIPTVSRLLAKWDKTYIVCPNIVTGPKSHGWLDKLESGVLAFNQFNYRIANEWTPNAINYLLHPSGEDLNLMLTAPPAAPVIYGLKSSTRIGALVTKLEEKSSEFIKRLGASAVQAGSKILPKREPTQFNTMAETTYQLGDAYYRRIDKTEIKALQKLAISRCDKGTIDQATKRFAGEATTILVTTGCNLSAEELHRETQAFRQAFLRVVQLAKGINRRFKLNIPLLKMQDDVEFYPVSANLASQSGDLLVTLMSPPYRFEASATLVASVNGRAKAKNKILVMVRYDVLAGQEIFEKNRRSVLTHEALEAMSAYMQDELRQGRRDLVRGPRWLSELTTIWWDRQINRQPDTFSAEHYRWLGVVGEELEKAMRRKGLDPVAVYAKTHFGVNKGEKYGLDIFKEAFGKQWFKTYPRTDLLPGMKPRDELLQTKVFRAFDMGEEIDDLTVKEWWAYGDEAALLKSFMDSKKRVRDSLRQEILKIIQEELVN